ncbi:mus81 structure-specific endonuclease subunit [Calliopsis andreniformis]|uniref:mus81 structure-specific endonuclease subunit n=1 Tax=Calliopsis andreniformis TaxID=337506 RepID=UPI003FCC8270
MKRVKLKSEKPNPLFELWLEEWRKEAVSRNSDLQHYFSKALVSLKKYPLPLKSGKDCIILQHFGTKLCSMLDKKLEKHKARNKGSSTDDLTCTYCNSIKEHAPEKKYKSQQVETNCIEKRANAFKRVINDNYLENNRKNQTNLTKPTQSQRSQSVERIISERFEQTEECFVSRKTKESNIHTEKLQEKFKKTKNPSKETINNAGGSIVNSTDSLQKDIYLEANKFDIILLVDKQETCGGKTKSQHDATLVELSQLGILFEVRHLKVGDFAWIARCRITNSELILPYVIERKRIDDLSASIIDGRYYEQKFRLKQSGIDNLMYIIEEYDKGQRSMLPHSSLMQASINTLMQDGFLVKYTKNHKDSMFYLSSLTNILHDIFKEKNLIGCKKATLKQADISSNILNLMEFQEFNKAASKQKVFKVSEMFIRHLLQLKGISVDKAVAIAERYSTPQLLIDALQEPDCNGEMLLSSIECGDKKRQLGITLSKTIYQLYTKKNLN